MGNLGRRGRRKKKKTKKIGPDRSREDGVSELQGKGNLVIA